MDFHSEKGDKSLNVSPEALREPGRTVFIWGGHQSHVGFPVPKYPPLEAPSA